LIYIVQVHGQAVPTKHVRYIIIIVINSIFIAFYSAICNSACTNGGNCTAPNNCTCKSP